MDECLDCIGWCCCCICLVWSDVCERHPPPGPHPVKVLGVTEILDEHRTATVQDVELDVSDTAPVVATMIER